MGMYNEFNHLFTRTKQIVVHIYSHQIKRCFMYVYYAFEWMYHSLYYILNNKTSVHKHWIDNNTTHAYGKIIIVNQNKRAKKLDEFIETNFDDNLYQATILGKYKVFM